MRHLFFSEGHLSGRAEVPSEDSGQSLESLGWPGAAFVGNFRFAILQMAAVLTAKSFFVVKSVAIRNGAVRSALADVRRRLSPFAMLVMGHDSRFRGGVAALFCFARVVAIQWCRLKKRCSKRCRPSGIRRSDYGRKRVHGKLR